jgi:hypothetical protein
MGIIVPKSDVKRIDRAAHQGGVGRLLTLAEAAKRLGVCWVPGG